MIRRILERVIPMPIVGSHSFRKKTNRSRSDVGGRRVGGTMIGDGGVREVSFAAKLPPFRFGLRILNKNHQSAI